MINNYSTFINNSEKSSFTNINEMIDVDRNINYIGRRVKIADTSEYRHQAYRRNGNGEGEIIEFNSVGYIYYDEDVDDDDRPYSFSVKWDNGDENSYRDIDLILIDEIDTSPKTIRWYKKGKFTTEIINDKQENIPHVGDMVVGKKNKP